MKHTLNEYYRILKRYPFSWKLPILHPLMRCMRTPFDLKKQPFYSVFLVMPAYSIIYTWVAPRGMQAHKGVRTPSPSHPHPAVAAEGETDGQCNTSVSSSPPPRTTRVQVGRGKVTQTCRPDHPCCRYLRVGQDVCWGWGCVWVCGVWGGGVCVCVGWGHVGVCELLLWEQNQLSFKMTITGIIV